MWLYVFIVVSSSCLVFISGNENGVPQGSVLKTQSLQDGARAANTTSTFDIQRRNLRLYPEWFSQRIKKIAGKRFTNSNIFPQEHRAAVRENVPTANYRRSNMYGLTSHSPIIVSDDIGDANNAPQSIPPGAELVDLPGNYQSLPPDDFHRLSYAHGPHPDLGDSDLLSMPEDDLRAFGHHHRRRHHHNLCNHHRLCLNGGTCIHHRHTRVRCSCRPGFHGHYCEIPAVTCLPNPCKNDGACTLHDKGFTCACAADFKGPSCMIPASCFSNPCQNGASCVELEAGFRCQCNPDYEGTLCDERISLCRNSPCKNGGVCKEEGTSFECICKEGYSCQDCSCNTTTIIKQTTKQSTCPTSSCKNGASCIVTDHGYSCQCMDGFHGEDCGIPDLCKRNPCENGGICVQVGSDYKCICSYGYKGINCNLPLSCVSHPCINGGNCHETDLDFHCKCGLGFKGETCQELNPCSHSPCANNAKCIERGPFYTCICQEGFRGKECKEKDPCSPSPCINGLCGEIKTGIAVCNCTEGWAGDLCELRNECFPNRCQNGGTCTHNGESYHCLCPIKYHGTSCELINPCSTDPCKNSGTCQITETGYICSCVDGHRGSHCEISSSCHPNPCHHGGRCYEGEHQYICECETGYAGKLCEVQAFCDANPCMNGGQCLEDIGTYSCHCPFGYLGKTCDQSICQPNPCKNGGTCIASNTEHGYACECSFPYHGHDCSEWDPCVPNPCNNGGQCKSHLKEINELHLHEGAIQGLLHGADESVVDVVEPEEESLGDDSLSMHHHPDLYEEHDQATNSEVTHIPHKELRKHLPKLDSDHHTVWPDTAESHIHDENVHDPWREHSDGFKQPHVDTLQEHVSQPIDGTLPAEREQQAVHRHEYDDEEELVHQYKARHPHLTNDDDDDDPADRHRKHHPHLYEEDGDRVHAEATQFKSHSGGLQAEVQSLNDEDAKVQGKHDKEVESFSDEDAKVHRKHDKEISQKIDSSTVEEITKNVVKAVLDQKAKNSKRGRVSKRGRIPKKITGHGEIRKRTLHNLYVCECPPGFLGAHCQHANPCQNSPCQNGGICLPRGNRYQCQCMSGYAGFHCDDLHPCDPSPCLHKGSCRLAHNVRGYHCDCTKGYRGYQCEKLDSCANGNPCQHGGKCANTNIGMECRCRQRYGGNLCEVDKCEGCSTNAHCKQGHCVCKPGFIGNGYKCKSIGDICSPDPCENAGKCVPGQDGKIFICQCKSGFTGSRCEFFNPCQSSPCRHNGLCVDSSNSRSKGIILVEHTDYKCFCPQGYRGKDCEETSLAACSSVPCLNNATCFDASDEKYRRNMKHPDDYECYCKNGYSGKQCEYPHYACWTHPCQNGGSCLDPSVLPEVSFDSHGYKCNCLPGYIGRNCEVTLHGPSPCYSAPCLHNGRCVDVTSNTDPDLKFDDLDDYKCFCNVMYSGKNCEVPFPACTSAPCYHNGTCLDGTTHPDFNFDETNYHCLCSPGFEGKNCERQYTFASPEEEEQILHPTEPPDFEPLTPTPMVIYERPPRTTPPMGKLEKANPAVVVVKHKDFEQNRLGSAAAEPPINHPSNVKAGQMDIPIEDIAIHQAKERAEHRLGTSKDGVESTEREQESSVVHIAPDNGSPGGAVAVVNQMPKDRSSDAAMARMVSVVPDAVTSQGKAVTPPGGVVSPPNAAASPPVGSPNVVNYTPQANAYMRSMAQRQAQAQQRAILQQQMQQRYAAYNAPAARSYQGYNYYAYPRGPMLQNAQARSLASKITSPLRNNWHQFYNRYVQQRQFSSNRGKKSKIPKSTSTKL